MLRDQDAAYERGIRGNAARPTATKVVRVQNCHQHKIDVYQPTFPTQTTE